MMSAPSIAARGSVALRSSYPTSSVARRPGRTDVALVGSAVQRLKGDRFEPVLFQLDSAEPGFRGPPGDPFDVAIDDEDGRALAVAGVNAFPGVAGAVVPVRRTCFKSLPKNDRVLPELGCFVGVG